MCGITSRAATPGSSQNLQYHYARCYVSSKGNERLVDAPVEKEDRTTGPSHSRFISISVHSLTTA
jgi:hypothetical protein